jgi:hypothetical protein
LSSSIQFIVPAKTIQEDVTILGKTTDGWYAVGIMKGNEAFVGWISKEQAEKSDNDTRMGLWIKSLEPLTKPLSDFVAWFGFKVEKAEVPYESQQAQNLEE